MEMTMKKLYTLVLAVTSLFALAACSDEAFDSKYYDPSKTTTVTCDKIMTGAFMAGRDYTFNAYWRMYTWDYNFGKLAQTIGFNNNSGSVYYINDGYSSDRWGNFYKILAQYRLMEKVYNGESAAEQADDRIFLALTEVFMYDHLSQIVDLFGPVPFTKAGTLGTTGNLSESYPAYDSDVELYKMMLTKLDALYNEISSAKTSVSSTVSAKLKNQDFINGGDLDRWLKYANSLRLRLGVHVAAQGALTSEGKAAVASAAGRALISNNEESIVVKSDYDGFKYWENFRDSFKDINNTASQKMIDAMQVTGKDDPRLKVIYTPGLGAEGKFNGKSTSETTDEQNARDELGNNIQTKYYASLDSASFTANGLLVSPVLSAAETYFLLAESYQQGYASGNAKDAFKKGVFCSIQQYYDQNINSDQTNISIPEHTYKATEAERPSEADCLAYAEEVWNTYSNKLEAIMTQKWLHFGIMQATQAWTDIRRTGYPQLDYPEDKGSGVKVNNIRQRVAYPEVEAANNTANYQANLSNVNNDSVYYVLFWAKELK